jgi:hypothetical protein
MKSEVKGTATSKKLENTVLQPRGYFTYHQVYQSKTLHGAHIAFICFCTDLRTNRNFCLTQHQQIGFVRITKAESVYSAVRSESLHNTDTFSLYRVNLKAFIISILFEFFALNQQLFKIYILLTLIHERY